MTENKDSENENRTSFEGAIRNAINSHSKENDSGTPDFILATFLSDTLKAYDKAVRDRGAWLGQPVELLDVLSTTSPAQDLTNKVISDLDKSRQELLNNLTANPGFLSTFGSDFVVQYGPVEFHTEDDSGSRGLGEFTLKIRQEIRVLSREFYNEFEKDNEADLKLHSLRQSLNGDIESV